MFENLQKIVASGIAIIAVLVVCAGLPRAAFGQAPALAAGLHTLTLERKGLPPIHYAISIPRNYSQSVPVPLVLALHFGGDPRDAGRDMLEILVAPALEDLGAIMVAPDSLQGGWDTDENEEAVDLLFKTVMATYRIDAKKVVVTGFSMGGNGTWHWAEEYPDRFSAAVPIAGRPPASADGWRVPVLAIHSRDDGVVPIGPTQRRIGELQQAGAIADLIVVSGVSHNQTSGFVPALKQAVPWLKELWN